MFDLIITDGLIIDGTGREAYGPIGIGIGNGRITAIGDLPDLPAKRRIEAKHLFITPGFIDIHSHSDFSCLVIPPPESKIAQGVTTEVIGNCGLSAAPCLGASRDKMHLRLREYGLRLSWRSLKEYLNLLEGQGLVNNLATLVGGGNIRGSIVGYDDRAATERELRRMKGLLFSSLNEGAFGLSVGLAYPPGCYTTTDELIELAGEPLLKNGFFTFHLRSESEALLEAISEVLKIARSTGVGVHISHLKASSSNRASLAAGLEMIDEARAEGMSVSCDLYPYLASSTDLDIILPKWAWTGGNDKELSRLKDPLIRERMKLEISTLYGRDCWEKIVISKVNKEKNKWMEGRSISDIAHQDVLEAVFDLLLEEGLNVEANFFFGDEENLKEILKRPYAMIGSDASARSKEGILSGGKPHPRAFGTFPRLLSCYVRKEGFLSLEEAIYKMTGLPASLLGLNDRGRIKVDAYADLVIIDPSCIEDLADYDDPFQYPTGIEYTIVNGQVVWEKGVYTGAKPGRVLRRL